MFKKILLASDGSEYSIRACVKAIEIAKYQKDAEITVLYVVEGTSAKSDTTFQWSAEDLDRNRKEKLDISMRKLKESGVSYSLEVGHGDPGPTIVNHANQEHYDLVVIGSRGLNALQEMVLGSVSHKVAKRTVCPVLIVK